MPIPPKHRKTIVDIDEDVCRLDRVIIDLQSSVNSLTRQLSNHNTVILGLDLEAMHLSYLSLNSV